MVLMDSKSIVDRLGGPSEVAKLCQVSPQAVTQWYGKDAEGNDRAIPNARLLFLRAIRPDVFDLKPKRLKARAA